MHDREECFILSSRVTLFHFISTSSHRSNLPSLTLVFKFAPEKDFRSKCMGLFSLSLTRAVTQHLVLPSFSCFPLSPFFVSLDEKNGFRCYPSLPPHFTSYSRSYEASSKRVVTFKMKDYLIKIER